MDAKQSAFSGRMWMVLKFVSAFCVALLVSGCGDSASSPVGISSVTGISTELNEEGYKIHRLTDDLGDDECPSWSPDGLSIVFTSDRDGTSGDVYVMDADGDNLRRLTKHRSQDMTPSWSPDGRFITFFSLRDNDPDTPEINPEIYVMDADGDNVRRLTSHNDWDFAPSWSPDSRFIVFCSNRNDNRDVYVIEGLGQSNGQRP